MKLAESQAVKKYRRIYFSHGETMRMYPVSRVALGQATKTGGEPGTAARRY